MQTIVILYGVVFLVASALLTSVANYQYEYNSDFFWNHNMNIRVRFIAITV